jgi:ribose-phosphate pyrophosphokinase
MIKVFSGNANRPLAEGIARSLKRPLGDATVAAFSDGEVNVKIDENVRGNDVFVIQPTNSPASNIIELLVMLDAVRRASPRRVTAVIPYFGYARQDRKDQPRVAITAKLMANLISTAGADPHPHHGSPFAPDPGVLRHPRSTTSSPRRSSSTT